MATEERDTSRVSVRTYVPAYQREAWDDDADELDMSRSEFVRSMVQAGRRGFNPGGQDPETGEDGNAGFDHERPSDTEGETAASQSINAEFDDLVLAQLEENCLSWDELLEALVEDVEDQLEDELEETIQRLQADNEIQHSGREGGYVRLE